MCLLSCLLGNLGNCPSKWLTNPENLMTFVRMCLIILATHTKYSALYDFFVPMQVFCDLANEYLSGYEELSDDQKESYQRRLLIRLKELSRSREIQCLIGEQDGIFGGIWGFSWTSAYMMRFFETLNKLKCNPGDPILVCRYVRSKNPKRGREIRDSIISRFYDESTPAQRQTFSVLFRRESPSPPLNVSPVVSPPVVSHPPVVSENNLAEMSKALALATPRGFKRNLVMEDVPSYNPNTEIKTITPLSTPRTPRTPRLPGFSNWLLIELFSPEFLEFLRQQAVQSQSNQLIQLYNELYWFFKDCGVKLLQYRDSSMICTFFQALNRHPVVKTALGLYHQEQIYFGMNINIVSDSNEENQKLFFEYLMMIINLKVWLSDDNANKSEFSAECAGKLWVFDDEIDSFNVYDLPEPAKLAEQLRAA